MHLSKLKILKSSVSKPPVSTSSAAARPTAGDCCSPCPLVREKVGRKVRKWHDQKCFELFWFLIHLRKAVEHLVREESGRKVRKWHDQNVLNCSGFDTLTKTLFISGWKAIIPFWSTMLYSYNPAQLDRILISPNAGTR